jgi:hypothetical protein
MRILLFLLLAAVAVAGPAAAQPQGAPRASPNDYAARWPLQLPAGAAAGVFTVDPALHAVLQDPALGDLQVFDAAGVPMPTARATEGPAAQWLRVGFASAGPADGAAGDAGVMAYRYAMPVELAAGAARVGIGTHRGDVALQYLADGAWRTAARLPADTDAAAGASTSVANEVVFTAPVAATAWRVISGRALSPSPTLELSVLPARVVFIAQGTPPYVLAAGHAVLRRVEATEAIASAGRARAATIGTRMAAPFAAAAPVAAPGPEWLRWGAWSGAGACVLGAGWFLLRRRRGALAAV